jgi:hypothetical protein
LTRLFGVGQDEDEAGGGGGEAPPEQQYRRREWDSAAPPAAEEPPPPPSEDKSVADRAEDILGHVWDVGRQGIEKVKRGIEDVLPRVPQEPVDYGDLGPQGPPPEPPRIPSRPEELPFGGRTVADVVTEPLKERLAPVREALESPERKAVWPTIADPEHPLNVIADLQEKYGGTDTPITDEDRERLQSAHLVIGGVESPLEGGMLVGRLAQLADRYAPEVRGGIEAFVRNMVREGRNPGEIESTIRNWMKENPPPEMPSGPKKRGARPTPVAEAAPEVPAPVEAPPVEAPPEVPSRAERLAAQEERAQAIEAARRGLVPSPEAALEEPEAVQRALDRETARRMAPTVEMEEPAQVRAMRERWREGPPTEEAPTEARPAGERPRTYEELFGEEEPSRERAPSPPSARPTEPPAGAEPPHGGEPPAPPAGGEPRPEPPADVITPLRRPAAEPTRVPGELESIGRGFASSLDAAKLASPEARQALHRHVGEVENAERTLLNLYNEMEAKVGTAAEKKEVLAEVEQMLQDVRADALKTFLGDINSIKDPRVRTMAGDAIPPGWVRGNAIDPGGRLLGAFAPQDAQMIRQHLEVIGLRDKQWPTRLGEAAARPLKHFVHEVAVGGSPLHALYNQVQAVAQGLAAGGPKTALKAFKEGGLGLFDVRPGANKAWWREDPEVISRMIRSGVSMPTPRLGGPQTAWDVLKRPMMYAPRGAAVGGLTGLKVYNEAKAEGASDEEALTRALLWGAAATFVSGPMAGVISHQMWNVAVPRMKKAIYLAYESRGVSGEAAATATNLPFTGPNVQRMARSPGMQALLHLTFFAPGLWEGMLRMGARTFMPSAGATRAQFVAGLVVAEMVHEGLSLGLSGHSALDNEEGHEADIEVTRFFPSPSGERQYIGMSPIFRPILQAAFDAKRGDPTGTLNLLGGRFSQAKTVGGGLIQNRDWKGDPIVPSGAGPLQAGQRVGTYLLDNLVNPAEVSALERNSKWGDLTAQSALAITGSRLATTTPVTRRYKAEEDLYRQFNQSRQESQQIHNQYVEERARQEDKLRKLFDNPGNQSHQALADKAREYQMQMPKLNDMLEAHFTAAKFGGDETRRQAFLKGLREVDQLGTETSTPADLPTDAKLPDNAVDRYLRGTLDPEQAAHWTPEERRRASSQQLTQMAQEMGVDRSALRDAILARTWGLPNPNVGVPSSEIDRWTTEWLNPHDAQGNEIREDPTDPESHAKVSEARADGIAKVARDHGISPDMVWQRIKLRMHSGAEPSALQEHYDRALDVEVRKGKVPKYLNENMTPNGDPKKWAEWDQQLAALGKKKPPPGSDLAKLQEARERGRAASAAVIFNLQQKDPGAYADYQRFFGRGRKLTEDQWAKAQEDTRKRYTDAPSKQEADFRDKVLEMWAASTPQARKQQTVTYVDEATDEPLEVTLNWAHSRFTRLAQKGWQDDAVAQEAAVAAGQ